MKSERKKIEVNALLRVSELAIVEVGEQGRV